MKELTEKERPIMDLLWANGPMFVREMVELMPFPKPHFNTVSTFVRILEQKGFVGHEKIGNSFRYMPLISKADYAIGLTEAFIYERFDGSARELVFGLLRKGLLTADDVWDLMAEIRQSGKK
ncbi:MAG: BlaI/MecI/CopY family transcriptional regulator [Paramuribaculum sp.]|nr:BlaI/MecI/CopY family transcriptional regulator [Paramuribaculum sp.]MDE6324462.1 BlaI/MecI/CopY family transcriptional regulator [Paramuribaculum sp.]